MNRNLRLAALPLLLLAAGASARPAVAEEDPKALPGLPQEIPPAAPRAPLPPEPKDAGKKAIQGILKRWFENEPRIPVKGKDEAQVKGERAKAAGELETEVLKWPGCLRLVAWWRTRLHETQPSENKATKIIRKEEFPYGGKTYTFATSVPTSYRGKGTDLLPVIITVIDKDADPTKVFKEVYGKLLDTHLVVASYEHNVPNAGVLLNAIYFAYLNYRCDRERFVLDGIGKGARFVEVIAAAEYSCLQWNGAVIRSPLAVQPLEANLSLFPVAVVEPAAPAPQAVTAAAEAHAKAGGPGVLLPAGDPVKVQDFIAGLPPRKAGDQKGSFEIRFKSSGGMPKWGLWFLVNQAVDGENNQPVRVAISRDPAFNVVDIDATNLAEGTLLLNDEVLDLDQPVYVRVNGIVVAREKVVRSITHTFAWNEGLAPLLIGPRDYFITAVLPFVVPDGDARIPKAEREAAAAAEKKVEEDRKKQEEADRLAAEAAKKAEEDAKNPPADNPPAPADAPPASTAGEWFTNFDEAKAKAAGRPFLVIVSAALADARQMDLALVLKSEEVVKALKDIHRVTLDTTAEGEEGKAALARLAEIAGSPDAKAPYLALFGTTGKLALAGLKDEAEVKAAVLKLLAGPSPGVPEPPKPTVVDWGTDYEEGRKKALAKGLPLVLLFSADPKTPGLQQGQKDGQAVLDELVTNDAPVTLLLSKAVCVRLVMGGAEDAKNLPVLAVFGAGRTAPFLCGVRIEESATKELVGTILGLLDPVSKPKEKAAADLADLLKQWSAPRAAAPTGPAPPEGGAPGK